VSIKAEVVSGNQNYAFVLFQNAVLENGVPFHEIHV